MKMITSLRSRASSLVVAIIAGLTVPACDVLDVSNPNNLTEESVEAAAAANAVVNGAVATNYDALALVWLPYLMATDEITWIGSRDAWGQLDQGFLSNFDNEFTDQAFPYVGQARWFADRAVTLLDKHVAATPTPALKADQARAYLMAGMIYTIIGEVQEDFAFSDKQEPAAAIGPTNMKNVLDQAITKLDKAVTIATELNNAELRNRAQAMRARARHSRAIWDKIKPSIAANPLVSNAAASADANAVIGRAAADWRFQAIYSSATLSNYMASEINSRGEQQFDTLSVVQVARANPKAIQGIKLQDPIARTEDPRIRAFLVEWKGSNNIGTTGGNFSPLTLTSTKHMHLILAEDELAKGNNAGFTTHINHVRAMDRLPDYTGQIPALDMLKHERRAALFVTGLRLLDMYRFQIRDPLWHPNSDARTKPGTLLPITCIERRANTLIGGC